MRPDGAGQSALLLLDAIAVLSSEEIGYAVIGAMAGSIHGIVRASLDADAVLSMGSKKQADLQKSFESAGFHSELRIGDADDPIPALLKITDDFENRVDLLLGLKGLEREAFARTIDVTFHGVLLRVIGREDFIAMKVFAGGPQDLADAEHAIAADRASLNIALIRRLAEQYGLEAVKKLEQLLG